MTGGRTVAHVLAVAALASACAVPGASDRVLVGAVYPTGGGQGPGGVEELQGVRLAADLANSDGGIRGRRIAIALEPANSSDAAPGAVRRLSRRGVPVVLGSYGSTISRPAAAEAVRRGVVFWETGAVGQLGDTPGQGELVFRFPPTGESLGREAVKFVRDELSRRVAPGRDLRYTVTYVDDEYGRSVGLGAEAEIRDSGLAHAATLPYDLRTVDHADLAARIREARTDVLVVSAYLEDAVAMRRALVAMRVPLVAGIGTSSSYCHLEFGRLLGDDAVGLFASDKPDGDVVRPDALRPEAAALLARGRAAYERRHGEPMTASALSGFAAGWALFHHVMPRASVLEPRAIADAARRVRLEPGVLPNGSGLELVPAGRAGAGANVRATSVVWEWVRTGTRAIVWPPAFATEDIALPGAARPS